MTLFVRIASVALAVILVASITNWLLALTEARKPAEPVRPLPAGQVESAQSVDTQAIARLLGAQPGAAGNIRALGVMAEGASGRGIALISVDGNPARTVRAGELIAPGVVLAEVHRDSVLVNRAGALQQVRVVTKPLPEGVTRVP